MADLSMFEEGQIKNQLNKNKKTKFAVQGKAGIGFGFWSKKKSYIIKSNYVHWFY